MLTLRNHRVELILAPEVGGGIAAFRVDGADIMRPATPDALAARDPLGLASFPLVPYSNRIRRGRFRFDGRDVELPLNYPPEKNSIHGQGWQNPWDVAEQRGESAELAWRHEPDSWPWAYHASQRFRLLDGGFEVTLVVENLSDSRMPAGLGVHPYYPRTPGMQLHARLDGWWETDAEVMPVAHHPVSPTEDWTRWLHAERTTDNVFSGWNGRAELVWPEHRHRLLMTASEVARYMVVYAPTDRPIAVVEPVTHPTDALNDPALPGIIILEPGETAALHVRFEVGSTSP